MDHFMQLPVLLLKQQTLLEVKSCNDYTAKYGLVLSDQEIGELVESRREALQDYGRVELGGGILKKLIMEFADSPYLLQDNYANTLAELQECFYYFKNEALEDITDDDLILLMKKFFDDECQGSVEYLETTILENICRDIRYGTDEYWHQDGYEDDYTEFFDDGAND